MFRCAAYWFSLTLALSAKRSEANLDLVENPFAQSLQSLSSQRPDTIVRGQHSPTSFGGFNPDPALRPDVTPRMRAGSMRSVVSILIRLSGRMFLIRTYTAPLYLHSFNPNSALRPDVTRFRLLASSSSRVSILIRPQGQMLRDMSRGRKVSCACMFQSPSGPKARCYRPRCKGRSHVVV
jgi:hypothetical protein